MEYLKNNIFMLITKPANPSQWTVSYSFAVEYLYFILLYYFQ